MDDKVGVKCPSSAVLVAPERAHFPGIFEYTVMSLSPEEISDLDWDRARGKPLSSPETEENHSRRPIPTDIKAEMFDIFVLTGGTRQKSASLRRNRWGNQTFFLLRCDGAHRPRIRFFSNFFWPDLGRIFGADLFVRMGETRQESASLRRNRWGNQTFFLFRCDDAHRPRIRFFSGFFWPDRERISGADLFVLTGETRQKSASPRRNRWRNQALFLFRCDDAHRPRIRFFPDFFWSDRGRIFCVDLFVSTGSS